VAVSRKHPPRGPRSVFRFGRRNEAILEASRQERFASLRLQATRIQACICECLNSRKSISSRVEPIL
jgi:hypothetical protein